MPQSIETARRQYQDDLLGRGTVLGELYDLDPPKKRIRGIYRTSRFNISYVDAIVLWECMEPIRGWVDSELASSRQRESLSDEIVSCAWALQQRLSELGRPGGFGVGQKIVNLYLKDQWALGHIDHLESQLHLPLDRIVLSGLGRAGYWPGTWSTWTRVHPGSLEGPEVADYRELQRFAHDQALSNGESPLVYEQSLWHRRSI